VGVALVAETLGGVERLTGSLAGTWLEVVAVETERRRRAGARRARRDRVSIVCGDARRNRVRDEVVVVKLKAPRFGAKMWLGKRYLAPQPHALILGK